MNSLLIVSMLVLFAIAPTAEGATIRVPVDQPTIQAGIDSASSGDTVLVACGVYTWTSEGTGDVDGLIRMRSGVTLLSETGQADCVTIDAEQMGRVVYCDSVGSTTAIEGFTITGGFTNTSSPGGGICCVGGSLPVVSSCVISGNYSGYYGGGMYNSDSSPILIDCIFADNSVRISGGGLYNTYSTPHVTRCVFLGNENNVGGNDGGGGIYNDRSSPIVSSCTFLSNASGGRGGGVYNYIGSDPIFTDCLFVGNSALGWGGAAYSYVSNGSFTSCAFTSNNAGTFGGAMYNFYSPHSISDCTFFTNSAGTGGGIYNRESSPTIASSILWGDVPDEIQDYGASTPTVTCCDVQGGHSGAGNIDEDPLFCDPDNGNFMLDVMSPCAPANNSCGVLIGAYPVGCGASPVEATSWGRVKAMYW